MTSAHREERLVLEPRWPIVATLGFFIAISIVLRVAVPNRSSLGPVWLVPALEVGLVLVLLAADPARVSGHGAGSDGSPSGWSAFSAVLRWRPRSS